jgi:hypothetical protein
MMRGAAVTPLINRTPLVIGNMPEEKLAREHPFLTVYVLAVLYRMMYFVLYFVGEKAH